jgi:cysteine-rich repeat protein
MKRKNLFCLVVFAFVIFFAGSISYAALCGNGVKEGMEQCDNGYNNSDSKPNTCRSDCTLPRCGDYVVDNSEECDDGQYNNNDKIPGACRRNCKRAHCGDGVLDLSESEQCDDGNNNAYDGCHECRMCYKPKDNLSIEGYSGQYFTLCGGNHEFEDKGTEGIIILKGSDYIFDCQGSALYGVVPTMQSAVSGNISMGAAAGKNILAGIGAKFSKRKTKAKTPTKKSPPSSGSGYTPPRSAFGYQGTGIIVKGNNIAIRNCRIEGFKYGIKLKSENNILLNNHFCMNNTDISAEKTGHGVENKCAKTSNWHEKGQPECSLKCN